MKKLMVLSLVLAIGAMSSAALDLKIVDNGNGTFGILSNTGYVSGLDTYFAAVGEIKPFGGAALVGAPNDSFIDNNAIEDGFMPVALDGVWGFIGSTTGTATDAGLWFDGIQGVAGATIVLYEVTASWELGRVYDTATLIPEPMTMGLLGLGALFLRRRK